MGNYNKTYIPVFNWGIYVFMVASFEYYMANQLVGGTVTLITLTTTTFADSNKIDNFVISEYYLVVSKDFSKSFSIIKTSILSPDLVLISE